VPENLKHFTTSTFWEYYCQLPQEIQELADKNYELLKQDPKHPSLHFKKIKSLWSVRVGKNYRALLQRNHFNHYPSLPDRRTSKPICPASLRAAPRNNL